MSVEYGFFAAQTEISELKALWQSVFGDSAAVTDAFFDTLYTPDGALLAQENGRFLGCAYLLRGIELVSPGAPTRSAAYLYALAVREDCRGKGIGRKLVELCAEETQKRGEVLCLMPGSDSLRSWYRDCCRMTDFGGLHWERFTADGEGQRVSIAPISPAEYTERREALLKDLPHARLPEDYFRFQAALCVSVGGGFFRLRDARGGDGIACVETETDGFYACEMLYTGDIPSAADAVARALGKENGRILLPGTQPGLMTAGAESAPNFWWGPLLD